MKQLLAGSLCALLLVLAGCSSPPADPTPTPLPSPTLSPTPSPAPTPTPEPTPTPITEEGLRASADFADAAIYDIFTDGGDFLVWCGPKGSSPATDVSDLVWVDGRTGARTLIPRPSADIITALTVDWPDRITVTTNGISSTNGWQGMPTTYHIIRTPDGQFPVTEDPWRSVDTDLTLGVRRAAVVADARAGVNDLSLVFVPPANETGMSEFIAAATYIPQVSLRYDPSAQVLFLTIEDTVLDSGPFLQGGEDWVYDFMRDTGLQYPYSTPMGSLGADNRFFTKAAISSDGTGTTITMHLTEYAQDYTAQIFHLGSDMFPTLRLVFREHPAQ